MTLPSTATYAVAYVAVAAVLVVGVYDVWAVLNDTPGDTISHVIQMAYRLVPPVALWWGALGGHFTRAGRPYLGLQERWVLLAWTTLLVYALVRPEGPVPRHWTVAWVIGAVGWGMGAMLLPQGA